MYASSKNSNYSRSTVMHICIICFHLTQRFLTIRFWIGFCTGIILMVIIYRRTDSTRPKFRPDQSKFEYEKNPSASDDNDAIKSTHQGVISAAWNASWDSLKKENTWSRHLYLVRHGQYFDNAQTMAEMKLTELGREQMKYTGKRLNAMNIRFDRLIHSGMVRALESATIIGEQLSEKLPSIEDKNLTEGLPVAPIPYAGISQHDVDSFGDRRRIDTAFATYFHRARSAQRKETHDIIVFHANLLRYFICKIMQFPVEAWLRITLNHGSITQITILSDGSVILKNVGDSGFIPSNKVTF